MHHKPINKYLFIIFIISALIYSTGYLYKADKVVQVDISNILNTRAITTLTNGGLVTWVNGVDRQNGYLTMAAALFKGDVDPKALPDNPLIPATQHHPEILLHYANNDGKKYQSCYIPDTTSFIIKVSKIRYNDLYLSLTSAYGDSKIQLDLIYKDGTEQKAFTVPDWFKDIAETDPDFSYVVHDRAKWGGKNNMVEKDHHNIDALNIHPDPQRVLTAVRFKNLSPTYIVLWAATGIKF